MLFANLFGIAQAKAVLAQAFAPEHQPGVCGAGLGGAGGARRQGVLASRLRLCADQGKPPSLHLCQEWSDFQSLSFFVTLSTQEAWHAPHRTHACTSHIYCFLSDRMNQVAKHLCMYVRHFNGCCSQVA